jgi:uncharacterized protein (TIGR02996 family)
MAKKPAKAASKPSPPTYPVNPALEAAVIANAEDDTPRLVYADWLDENGDPDRAAFIRTQVALWDKHPADADYTDLVERRHELNQLHFTRRLKPTLPEGIGIPDFYGQPDSSDVGFHRGFPFFCNAGPEELRQALPFIFGETTIRGFNCAREHLTQLLERSYATNLAALCLGEPEPDIVRDLLASPVGANLKWLELDFTPATVTPFTPGSSKLQIRRLKTNCYNLSPTQVKRVLTSGSLQGLHRLEPRFHPNQAATGVKALAGLPELHTLEFWGALAEVPAAFAAVGSFPSLGMLLFQRTPLRGAGAKAIAKPKMPQLTVLDFHGCELQNGDVVTMTKSPLFDHIRSLRLSSDNIGDTAIQAVAASDSGKILQRLELSGSNCGKRGFRTIGTAFPGLTTLTVELPKSKFDEGDLARFFSEMTCDRLRTLELGFPLSDTAAVAIANNPALSSLRTLKFEDYHTHGDLLTSRGLTALFTSKNLSNLTNLDVQSRKPGNAASLLLDRSVLPNLRRLALSISDELLEKLQRERANLSIFPSIL